MSFPALPCWTGSPAQEIMKARIVRPVSVTVAGFLPVM